MSWIQMRDFWTFRPTEVSQNAKHLFECTDSKSDTGHSLLVHVAATHSGIVNGNRRFYRPDKMQDSVHTFLPQKTNEGKVLRTPRPVLIGHNEQGEVLGRVLEATYVDESWRYAGDFPIVKDFIFYQKDGRKRHDLYRSTDWIIENLAPLEEYTGLGYIDLGLRITNPEAIRKVLADEYLTVSVGFKTDAAICSLCQTNWATDGKCSHKLGEIEDGKQMFLIAGQMDFQEVSFINFPADPFATTLSKKVLTDSLEKMFFLGLPIIQQNHAAADGLVLTDGLLFEADLQQAEEPMEFIDMSKLDLNALALELKDQALTQERAQEVRDSLSAWSPETEDLKSKKRSLVSTVTAKIRKNGWDKIQDSTDATDATDAAVAEELQSLMEDAKKKGAKPGPSGQSKGVSKKSAEKTKEFQQKEIAGSVEHDPDDKDCQCEECVGEGADAAPTFEEFSDWAPSNDADRDYFADAEGIQGELMLALEDGATVDATDFCGPNKTFPVPTAAAARAARKVLDAAKISTELKDQIKTNISIKEASFPPAEIQAQDRVEDARVAKFLDSILMEDAEKPKEITSEQRGALVTILKSLDKGYDSLGENDPSNLKWILRNAVRAMLADWAADDEVAWSLKYLAGQKDHVVLSRTELDEKDEAIGGFAIERDALLTQIKNLTDSRAVILASTKEALAQQIVMHRVLKGQDGYKDLSQEAIAEQIETLSRRHITSLKDSVSDILSGLKFIDSVPAESQTPEVTGLVDDNTQITETATSGTHLTDGLEAESDPDLKRFEKSLRFMSQAERERAIRIRRFQSVKTQ
jgi:hypothetical protein